MHDGGHGGTVIFLRKKMRRAETRPFLFRKIRNENIHYNEEEAMSSTGAKRDLIDPAGRGRKSGI